MAFPPDGGRCYNASGDGEPVLRLPRGPLSRARQLIHSGHGGGTQWEPSRGSR
jgi:hypothetical protein